MEYSSEARIDRQRDQIIALLATSCTIVVNSLLIFLRSPFFCRQLSRPIMPVERDRILNRIAKIGAEIALGVKNHLLSDRDMVSHFGATPDVVHTIWFVLRQDPA